MSAPQSEVREDIARIMASVPVIPMIVIEDLAHAVPLAKALVAGGLAVLG